MEDTAMGTNETDKVGEQPLSCDQCPSVFTSLPDLEEHLETHKEERPYKCGQCEKSYRHAGSLVNHRKTHEVGLFSCLICQKDLSNSMALKNHLRTHSEDKRFQCTECGEGFRSLKQLSNHSLAVHSDISYSYAMASDEDVGSVHENLNSSMPLIRENHNLLSNLENYIAESMVPADFSHLELKDLPEPSLSCNAKESPADGQQVQSEERRYKCNQCDKAYKHAGSLANHRQSHTIGVYQCAVCFKEFSNRMALKNHSRLHTEYKPYNCTLCDQCFRLPSELASHQKLHHTGDRPFVCEYCGQGFLTKRELHQHKRLHINIPVEAEAGKLRTSEGSENSISEEEDTEPSAKIHIHQHPFQEDCKESCPEEPLSNHCGNVSDLSLPEGSPCTVPQPDQQNDKAPFNQFSNNSNLLPENEKSVPCVNCSEVFPNKESLTRHTCKRIVVEHIPQDNNQPTLNINLKEEPQSNENSEERPYRCEECGKTYRHAGSLINHKNTHQTGVYDCSICTKQLFNMAALKNHLRAHLKNRANRGLDSNLFNSTNFVPDSFNFTDTSHKCNICGESCASESDLQLHHMLHEDIKMPATSAAFPFLKSSPQASAAEDSEKPEEGNDSMFYLDQQRVIGLAVAEQIKEMKRERGITTVPSQGDEAVSMQDQDYGTEDGSLLTTGFDLKEEPCPDGTLPQQAVSYQSQVLGEEHNHTFGEDNLSEFEGQSSQESSTDSVRRYKCNLCDRTYRHRGSLVNHKHTHQTGIYQCSICPKQYSNVMALRNHVRMHFRSPLGKCKSGIVEAGGDLFSPGIAEIYSCTKCGEAFKEEKDWHAHQLIHSSQKDLKGNQTANGLQVVTEDSIHGMSHLYNTNEESSCKDQSNFRLIPGDEVAEQIEEKDSGEDRSRKEATTSEDFDSFQDHILIHEGKTVSSVKETSEAEQTATKSEIGPMPNASVQETSEQMESLRRGFKVESEKRMYTCDLCGKSYRHSGSLINHKRIHQMGDYVCSVCSKQFNNLATLKNHLRSHQRSKRERMLENSEHPLFSLETNYLDVAFRDTSCEKDFSNEAEHGGQLNHHSDAEMTSDESFFASQVSLQTEMFKELTEDLQTLHTDGPNQLSECDSSSDTKDDSINTKGIYVSDDSTSKQTRCEQKAEVKNDNDSNRVEGVINFGENAGCTMQQAHKGEEGEKCTSGVSPVQTNPSIINEEHLEGSPDLDSTEERPYKCDECGKTYRHAGSLVNHKHTHQTGIYQCSFCPKEYPNLMGLRNHIRTHTKPQFNRMGNSSSDDFFGLPGEIHQPRSGEELYDCSLCGMVFSDEGDFHQHQFAHGSPGAPSSLEVKTGLPEYAEDPYNCITDGNFAQLHLSDFSLHMHAAERDLLSRLKDEMKDMAQGEIQDISYFNESHLSHICGFCGKTYDDLESLNVHSESHSDENEAPSDEVSSCPRVDFEKLHFDVSKLSEAEGSVNKSEMIVKTNFLIDDLKVNEGPESRPYACNQCEKTYRHGGSLVNHKKTHLIGDYQCSGCSRQYPNLAAYRNHLRHHPKCKVLANTNDELKPQTSSKSNHSNRSASVSHYPGGSVVAVEHSSSTSLKEPDAHQDHKLRSSALSQNGNDYPAEMSTKISNKKSCSIEVPNTLHYAENCDGDIPGDASLDHKLNLAAPNLTSVAVIGKVDRSTEISMLDAVDTKPKICDSCGHICESAVGLDNHKTCSCTGHSSQCPDGDNSDFIFDDTKKKPTSDKKNSSQELGEGSFQQRPFRCEVCGRSYRHAGSLINHKQAHKTGLFRCGVCQKRFFNMMALKNHNRIHFEMKRYKCSDCGKAFRLQKQLLAHQKMHRDKADHARRSNRNGKREVKIPLRLLDELMLVVPSGASSESKPGGGTAEKKVRLKQRHPKKILDPDERPYRCEQCGRSYRHAGSLLNHKRSHTMGHYCCTICDKTYPNLMAMKNHQRVHFEVKRHVCPECGKAFKWQRQLTRHQLLHTIKKYKCDLCGQNIQGKTLFEQHQMEHRKGELLQEHTGSDILEKPLNIQITSKKRKVARRRIRSLKKEIGRDHKNLSDQDNKPICKLCRYVFSTFDELEAHHCENPIQSTQSDPEGTTISLNQKPEDETLKQEGANAYHTPSQPEERPYKCSVCGRTYRHAGSLLNHKNTHTLGIYKCFVCLKQFFNPMAIRNHIRIHTATKRFQCQVCGKAFRASRELITHNRVHTGERPFNCPVCQRGFSSKLSLKQHQHVHNRTGDQDKKGHVIKHPEASFNGLGDGVADLSVTSTEDPAGDSTGAEERPYKCSQCDRAYRHAGSLLNHKKTHTTGVYYCPTCQKQFFNLLAMKNHLRIHLNQNRYKCLDCGKAFRVSSRLASHRRIHMQGGPFPCHQCPKRFFRKSTFQKHQLLHKDREGILPQDGMAPNVLVEVT